MKIECGICFEALTKADEEGASIKAMRCGHLFHGHCIENWLNVNNTCPHCRKRIDRAEMRRIFMTNVSHRRSTLNAAMAQIENFREVQDDLLSVQTANDQQIAELKAEIERYKEALASKDREIAIKDQQIEQKVEEIAKKDLEIEKIKEASVSKDRKIARKDKQIEEKREELDNKDRKIAKKDRTIAALKTSLEEKTTTINDLVNERNGLENRLRRAKQSKKNNNE